MGYRERRSRVDRAVVWQRAGGGAGQVSVFPDGCMDLIWTEGTLMVAGPDTRAARVRAGAADFVGVRFAPGAAPAVLGVPAVELLDQRVELDTIVSAATARALLDQVDNSPDRVVALESVAVELAAAAPSPEPILTGIVDALAAGESVAHTAARAGLSARMLHRRSLAAFGYGPKMLARILRFQRALETIRTGTPAAEAAVLHGYADQAHLSREVRDLGGCTVRSLQPG
ncbi:helix-turn-helix domain-containing protein [Nocardia sp. NPDC050378]|uniref:helix-turn-helix domain-containing protein n=1 Tax=Nocardia sp. NPDC050378 TaxID=3155400 RepID=UPI003401FEC3